MTQHSPQSLRELCEQALVISDGTREVNQRLIAAWDTLDALMESNELPALLLALIERLEHHTNGDDGRSRLYDNPMQKPLLPAPAQHE